MDENIQAVSTFNKLAQTYQDKFMDTSLYHASFDLFCNGIEKQHADVLELACGPGNITQYLLKKRPDFRLLGLDLAPNMIALARINNPGSEFRVMDCRHIDTMDQTYDAVMCGFCLPYLSKMEAARLIAHVERLLRPGGLFYLSTMEGDDSLSGYKTSSSGDSMYMHYHQGAQLTKLLKENNFKIIEVKRQDYPETDGSMTTDLIMIAKK